MIGICYLENYVPHHAAFNCACGDTRGIVWAEATEEQRREAYLADLSRQPGNELMMEG
jgi:hypothetical protein